VTPLVDDFIDDQWRKSVGSLRNDDTSAAFVEFVIEPVAVESLVCEQVLEVDAVDEGWYTDGVKAVTG
jgi:hypothetical protein